MFGKQCWPISPGLKTNYKHLASVFNCYHTSVTHMVWTFLHLRLELCTRYGCLHEDASNEIQRVPASKKHRYKKLQIALEVIFCYFQINLLDI